MIELLSIFFSTCYVIQVLVVFFLLGDYSDTPFFETRREFWHALIPGSFLRPVIKDFLLKYRELKP